jgi:hypothetical protein
VGWRPLALRSCLWDSRSHARARPQSLPVSPLPPPPFARALSPTLPLHRIPSNSTGCKMTRGGGGQTLPLTTLRCSSCCAPPMYVCMSVYVCVYAHIYERMCVCVYVYMMCIYAHIHVGLLILLRPASVCIHERICVCIYIVRIHGRMCVYVYMYTYA